MDLGQGDGRSVGAGGNKSAQDGLGEGRVGSAGKESEQLHEEVVVEILGLGVALVLVLEAASVS